MPLINSNTQIISLTYSDEHLLISGIKHNNNFTLDLDTIAKKHLPLIDGGIFNHKFIETHNIEKVSLNNCQFNKLIISKELAALYTIEILDCTIDSVTTIEKDLST